MCDEVLDDVDRRALVSSPDGCLEYVRFDWYGAFEAGKRDRYTGDPSDTCTCDGCRG